MLNQCTFIGNLGKDPEVRTLNDGGKVANFSIGVSERWKDKNSGEMKEKTEWVRVVAWGNLAEIVAKYCSKGSKVYVAGKMQTREWTDKDNVKKYTTEIVLQGFDSKLVLLTPKGDGNSAGQSQPQQQSQPRSQQQSAPKQQATFIDDEIPF